MEIRPLENFPAIGAGQTPSGDLAVIEARPAPAVRPVEPESSTDQSPEQSLRQAKELKKVAEGVNTVLENSGSHVRFMPHEKSGQMMVEILDNRTDEVIRTIPSKELLDLAARIGEMIGVILDKKT